MKIYQLFLVVLIFLGFISCQNKHDEITITGKIIGEIPEKVEFTTLIDGKWFYGDKKSIAPDSTGNFQIKMKIDEPSFVTMYVPRKSGGVLLVEPDKTHEVVFNIGENKNENKFFVNSVNSFAQNLYNSFPTPEFYISGVRDFFTNSILSEISKKINVQKEKAISQFDELLEKEKISKGFHELAVLDRKSYYLALEVSVVTMLTYKYINESDKAALTQFVEYWDKKFDKSMLNESNFIRSPWFYVLANKYLRFKQLSSEGFDPKHDERAYGNGDLYIKTMLMKLKKFFWGMNLNII